MKPDFALSLSFEGIHLLARAAGGWRVAGDVLLDDADLAGALVALRQRAVDLGGSAFRTKLIIPNDQIRYLSVDTGHVSTADRIDKVRMALDGATPYAVEDLVYDICVDGPHTHVAAVARQTLEEAEAFAMEHRFSPVSYVAVPGDEAFLGEPFFGPTAYSETALATGERVEPDGVAVVVIGPVAAEEIDADPPGQETAAPIPAGTPSGQTGLAETPSPQDPPAESAAPPLPGFSSRRTRQAQAAPALGGATRSSPSPQIIAPQIAGGDDDVSRQDAAPSTPTRDEDTPDPALLAATLEPDRADPAEETPALAVQSVTDPDPAPSVTKTWAARFLSRRAPAPPQTTPTTGAATPIAAPPRPIVTATPRAPVTAMADFEPADERSRMTIFGMREDTQIGGAPRHLGLILTAVLLLFLAGVAAWASVFREDGLAGLFERAEPVRAAQVPQDSPPAPQTPDEPSEQMAALDPGDTGLTDTDAAVLDALRAPQQPVLPTVLDPETAQARYVVSGIWQRAPDPPGEPGLVTLDDLYLTSIDAPVAVQDAVALPRPVSFETDLALGQIISPAAPGSAFAFDENGRVLPSPDGALSPDGFTVFLGRPPVLPPATPARVAITPEPEVLTSAVIALRPRLRPGDLVEQTERTQLGGLTRDELSDVRPRLRPEIERTEEESDETPTAQAVLASLAPRLRPSNMARIVDQASRAPAEAPAPTQVASAAAATVTPQIPSSASVARAATVNNAINLRRVNLIGVYGTPSNRRALVRLPNGRYKKVQVGDRLDGGRISAIGESELRYQKGNRNLVLTIPSG